MSLKKLRAAFASAFDSADPDSDSLDDCPEAEVLYKAYHGQLSAEQFNAVTDHMAECPICAQAYRLARGTPGPVERTHGPSKPRDPDD